MPLTERARLARLAFLVVAATGGCSIKGTGIDVKLHFNCVTADSIDVLVRGVKTHFAPGRDLREGDDFFVIVSESLEGQEVSVDVTASFGSTMIDRKVGSAKILKRDVAVLDITLGACLGDMAVPDMAMPDMAVASPDLSGMPPPDMTGVPIDLLGSPDMLVLDMSIPNMPIDMKVEPDMQPAWDFAVPPTDFTVGPDIRMTGDMSCMIGCVNNVETHMVNGVCTQLPCDFGPCQAGHCPVPSTCAAPGDISVAPKTYSGHTETVNDNNQGSCSMAPAFDNALMFTVPQGSWSNVQLKVQAAWQPQLYTRFKCFQPASEIPGNGPCVNLAPVVGCKGGASPVTQQMCGLPPGTYYAFVDGVSKFDIGEYTISTLVSTADLQSCAGAGMVYPGFTSAGSITNINTGLHVAPGNKAPANTPNCGDLGSGPDFIYFVPVPAGKTALSAKVTTLDVNFRPLVYITQVCPAQAGVNQTYCGASVNGTATTPIINTPAAGNWFVVVDGDQGTSGSFTLTVTLQ